MRRQHSCPAKSVSLAQLHILLNEKQAAAYLGLTDRTLQQRRYYSQPPVYIKLPGSNAVRYRLSDIMAFVAAGEVLLP